ncbi:MAG: hypothetical protein GQ574_09550 [Crocinitomix sp.]|nr:hypothetical protein [Crocinitomix sp.]
MKWLVIFSVTILFSCGGNEYNKVEELTEVIDSLSYKWRSDENDYHTIGNRRTILPFLIDSLILNNRRTTEAIYGMSSKKGECQKVDFRSPYTTSVDKIEAYYGDFRRPFGIRDLNDSIPVVYYKVGFAYSGPLLLALIYDSDGICLGSLYSVCWN